MARNGNVHLVVGGFPPGEPAGHDMDFARRQLLGLLAGRGACTPAWPVTSSTSTAGSTGAGCW